MSIWQGNSGGLNLKGSWNATTNSPALGNSGAGGVANDLYIVSVAGTTSLDGINTWNVGDYVINNGSVWSRIPAGLAVVSVAGKNGVVTLVKADITNFTESNYVHSTGDEAVAGVKTFGSSPIVPDPTTAQQPASKNYSDSQDAIRDTAINLRALDSAVVHKTGVETVAGAKTFQDVARFGDVAGGNYLEVEQGTGVIRVNGNGRTWKDTFISAYALPNTGATAPSLDSLFGSGSIKGLGFTGAGTQVNEVSGSFEMNHDWAEGSDISFHIHWMPSDANAGNVKWQLEYTIKNPNGTFSAPIIIAVVQAGGIAWRHQLISFSNISMTGLTIGSVIMFRLFRDPADAQDTYGSHAILMQVGLHYLCDTEGSRQMITKS